MHLHTPFYHTLPCVSLFGHYTSYIFIPGLWGTAFSSSMPWLENRHPSASARLHMLCCLFLDMSSSSSPTPGHICRGLPLCSQGCAHAPLPCLAPLPCAFPLPFPFVCIFRCGTELHYLEELFCCCSFTCNTGFLPFLSRELLCMPACLFVPCVLAPFHLPSSLSPSILAGGRINRPGRGTRPRFGHFKIVLWGRKYLYSSRKCCQHYHLGM